MHPREGSTGATNNSGSVTATAAAGGGGLSLPRFSVSAEDDWSSSSGGKDRGTTGKETSSNTLG